MDDEGYGGYGDYGDYGLEGSFADFDSQADPNIADTGHEDDTMILSGVLTGSTD